MARKPAHLERAGALTPRDRVWGAIRALGAAPIHTSFSAVEVAALSGVPLDTTQSYVAGLLAATPPFLHVVIRDRPAIQRQRREFFLMSLVRDVGVEAPRVTKDGKPVTAGLANEQMWNAMRILGDFNADELRLAASTPAQGVTEENAVFYCQYLKKAGYLVVTRAAKPGTKARFRFVKARNTGPRAPLIQRDKSVMDGNTGEVVWRKP